MSLRRAATRTAAFRCAMLLAAAVLLSMGKPAAAEDVAPQLMPPHPNLLARLQAEGYDSVTVVNLRRLTQLRRLQGVDMPGPISAPVTGTRPALVLLVDFSNYSHQSGSTFSIYTNLLFSVDTYPTPGSMRDFYRRASYGQYDISPCAVDAAWRMASQTRAYYAGSSNGTGTYPQNAQKLVEEAVDLAHAGGVNFATYAVGGQVQGLFVIHAGAGAEASGNSLDIWSHMWALNSHAKTVDGVIVNVYSIEPEYVYSPGDSTIGVFAHEYGHVIGLPDLYDTDYTSAGLGDWSLMAGGSWNGPSPGGSSPAFPDAYCRTLLGWVTPQEPTTTVTGANLPAVETSPTIYRLWTNGATGTEYFLLENRQKTDFDQYLPGAGLLLYHVDESVTSGNDNEWHPLVMLEQADGLWDLQYYYNGGDAADPFPGTDNVRSITADTLPGTRSYASADTKVALTSIGDSGSTMTADISVQYTAVEPRFEEKGAAMSLPKSNCSAWGDYDGDGYPDLYIGALWGLHACMLLHNNGDGTFTDVTVAMGLLIDSQYWEDDGAAWGDFNNDGRLDLIVTGGNHNPILYRNDGNHFTDIGGPSAGFSDQTITHEYARSVAWDDYDGDNWLDVYITYLESSSSRLYHNNRDGTFTEVTSAAGMAAAPASHAHVLAWADYNNDGANDLVVGRPRTDASLEQPQRLYRSNGDGTFTEVAAAAGIAGLADSPGDIKSAAWGDYNNDGNIDLFLGPGHTRAPWLFHNNGNGTFTDAASSAGIASPSLIGYGAAWGDYDNDSYADLLSLAGEATGTPLLWHNNGGSTFTESHDAEGLSAVRDFRSAGWADYDRDGRLDFVATTSPAQTDPTCLYHNLGRSSDGHYLRVRAITDADGDATDADTSDDRDAIGARVDVNLVNDAAFGPGSTMVRFIDGGSGWMGQNEQAAHFGLGNATTVAVRVTFPDGKVLIKTGVSADGEADMREGPQLGGTLTGTVTDVLSSAPIAAATIECVGVGSTTTNLVGRFLIPSVPTGTYTVNVTATGYVPASTPDVHIIGNTVTTANFSLQRNIGAIGGVVTDARTASPIAGASVTCGAFLATTAVNGTYLITQVPVGAGYAVSATADDYQGATSDSVSVSLGATTTVNLALTPLLGAISGTVRDSATQFPIVSASVAVAGQSATTDRQGRYRFDSVRVGSYTVTAGAAGYTGASRSGVAVLLNQTSVVDLNLTATATGSVAGTVRDAGTQAPIPNATVTCGAMSAKTDASGAYTLSGVPVGEYSVGAAAGGYTWAMVGGVAIASQQTTTQDFSLTKMPSTQGAQFEEIQSGTFPTAAGAAWGDYNGDGYPDLFVSSGTALQPSVSDTRLYRNGHDLSFTDVTTSLFGPLAVVERDGPAWADYNNDGLLDVLIACGAGYERLYRHDPAGFVEVSGNAGFPTTPNAGRSIAWCDYDGDGLLDAFCSNLGMNYLMHNNGDGTFTEVSASSGLVSDAGMSASWGDYDNDGWPDLLIARNNKPAMLFHNSGNGTFTDVSAPSGIGAAVDNAAAVWGDYDNDGWLDCYLTTNMSAAAGTRDCLFHNNHNGTFTDVGGSAGMAGDTAISQPASWADYDNDGWLDLYVGNMNQDPFLYHNNGDGTFTDVSLGSGLEGTPQKNAAIWADIDLDGRLDLFVALGAEPQSHLFHNIGVTGNWLRVRALTSATGDATDASKPSRDAIGARVELNVDNDANFLPGRTLIRLIDGGSGWLGQNEQIAQFGIPTDGPVAVRVRFAEGTVVVHRGVAVNQQIVIRDVPTNRTELFSDVPLDSWAYSFIRAVADATIAGGYSDGTYRPALAVTRDQMAVYISRALAGGDSKVPVPTGVASFPDVLSDYWAFKYIEYAKASKVVTGYPDGTYQPTVPLDRGQMAVFIARSIATPTGDEGVDSFTLPTTPSFSDVPTSFWSYKYIEFIKSKSVTSGYPDGLYHPEYTCTRDQMAVYIARAFALGG